MTLIFFFSGLRDVGVSLPFVEGDEGGVVSMIGAYIGWLWTAGPISVRRVGEIDNDKG